MQYYFKSDKQYLNYITDISDIGSYYNIELDGKIRNYTNMLSASEYNSKLNIDIINILKKSFNNEQFEVPNIEESEYSNNLPLIIKIYNFPGALSLNISKQKLNTNIKIEGPYGEGLKFKENNNKHLVFIVGGTGILPIIDFIDLIFKKLVYLYFKEKGIKHNSYIFKLYNYENLFKDDQFEFIGSFNNLQEFFGFEIINYICILQDYLKINIINVNIRISRNLKNNEEFKFPLFKSRLTKDFLKGKLRKDSLVYLCGPPVLNSSVIKLIKYELENNEIIII